MEISMLGISGSPIKGGNTDVLVERAMEMASRYGVKTKWISLSEYRVGDCKHCNWCVTEQQEGRFCIQQDDMQRIYPLLLEADAILLATPVYIARLSGYLASFMDRWRAFLYGNFYRGGLKNKVGAAMAVGWFRNSGMETALLSILYGFFLYEMIPVGAGGLCPWGVPAVSSKGGLGRFRKELRHGVLDDEYGQKALSSLIKKVVEVTRIVKRGLTTS